MMKTPHTHSRIDVLWWHIANLVIPGKQVKRLKVLPKVAKVTLVIQHSNAELERLFSIVRKNKSLDRSSLSLDGTLSSILATKTMYPKSETPCYKWRPTQKLLETSKKATTVCNSKKN